MRALIQRVQQAKVVVNNQTVAQIQQGLLVFIGIAQDDTLEIAKKLLDKVFKYRVFEDADGKMGWNVNQVQGKVLLVSQFTLMANTQKGLRPDFGPAMPPLLAKALYDALVDYARQSGLEIETGIFGADMQVHLVNDGPATFQLECTT